VWAQQYYGPHEGRWRVEADLPPHAQAITSPYDGAARFATKRETAWPGYKVDRTETCEDATPHLSTNGEPTPATATAVGMTETIHTHLAARTLVPRAHLLDSGYVAADLLVTRQQDHQIDLGGPVLSENSWPARQADGLDLACFAIDWDRQSVTWWAGKTRLRWTPGPDHNGDGPAIIAIQGDAQDGRAGPWRPRGTQAKERPRTMKRRPRDQHPAWQVARKRQTTEAFKQLDAARAGSEGTLSHGVCAFGQRHTNYIGQARPHLQPIRIAIAIKIGRVVAGTWDIPRATPRRSPLARLVAPMT